MDTKVVVVLVVLVLGAGVAYVMINPAKPGNIFTPTMRGTSTGEYARMLEIMDSPSSSINPYLTDTTMRNRLNAIVTQSYSASGGVKQ